MTGLGTGAFQFFVPGSPTVHPVMWITYLNILLVLACTGISIYYLIRGREAFKWLMVFNLAICSMIIALYTIFFIDIFWQDILSKSEVSLWIIKPMYTILMAGFLTNIIVSGRRRDGH
jgi:hypothetical protein